MTVKTTTKDEKYCADYLKVTKVDNKLPVKDIKDVISSHNSLGYKEDSSYAGGLSEIFRTPDYAVLRLHPHSVDLGVNKRDTMYKTREEALGAVIEYLTERGYEVKPFDLEDMVDKI